MADGHAAHNIGYTYVGGWCRLLRMPAILAGRGFTEQQEAQV